MAAMASLVKGTENGVDKNKSGEVEVSAVQSDIKPAAIDEEDMLEGQTEIGGVNAQTFKRLRPTGQRLAQIFEDAKRREEEPEEEPVYYWDDDFDGNPDELDTKEKVWHNVHSMGYSTFKGMEFLGEIAANFFGLNQSKYQWIVNAKKKEEAEKGTSTIRIPTAQMVVGTKKIEAGEEAREEMEEEIVNDADALEGGNEK